MTARWLPEGFHTITPNIIAEDTERAVDFLKTGVRRDQNYRLTLSDGAITHCEPRRLATRSLISVRQWKAGPRTA